MERNWYQGHGSPWDRGSADSYYGRPRVPHRGGVGGESGEYTTELTADEVQAYLAGYAHNEALRDKKSWD